MSFNTKPECLVISPGGCGSNTLINYLNNYTKSNIFFEKKYKFFGLSHLYKPNYYLNKNNIKIILIKRKYSEIYKSMLSRGFIRNNLNILGDCLPFIYINLFKNKKKLKKKYYKYLNFFYNNWRNYNKENLLVVNFKDLYRNSIESKKIKKFLQIKDSKFLIKFPKYKRYPKENYVDPSTILTNKIYKI